VSKQDSHFANIFSVVLGLLVTFTILMFALARYVGSHTQRPQVLEDDMYVAGVQARTQLPVRLAIAGQDNSVLTIEPPAGAKAAGAGAALPLPKDGHEAFEAACKACHGEGLAGAPKAGDHTAWAPRIAQGKATLYQHALNGFQNKGVMPAKGGRVDFSDELVKSAVDYMTSL
jgi:cytochrome c5